MNHRRKNAKGPSDETVSDWLIAGVVVVTLVLGVAYVSKDRIDARDLSKITPAAGSTEKVTYDSPNYGRNEIGPVDERPPSGSDSSRPNDFSE